MALNHHQILCYNDKFLYLRSSYNITTTTLFKIMMNKYQIGTNAGIVWRILSDNAHWDYEKLKEVSGLSDRDLNAAIGWLAREDKIDFDIDEQHDRLFYMSTSISVNAKIPSGHSPRWYFLCITQSGLP